MLKANGQQFLRLYGELQRQFGEDVFTEAVDDHRDGIVFADPALQAVEQLIFANPRSGRLVLQLGAVVPALDVREGVRPALVVGMPVGFVSAAESKDLMAELDAVPWIVIRGRKGGSTLVVAALHALLALAEARQKTLTSAQA